MPGQRKAEPPGALDADDVVADVVAAEIARAHAAVSAAISIGYGSVEDAMRQAQEAVALAVRGATEAVRLAQQATNGVAGHPGDEGKQS